MFVDSLCGRNAMFLCTLLPPTLDQWNSVKATARCVSHGPCAWVHACIAKYKQNPLVKTQIFTVVSSAECIVCNTLQPMRRQSIAAKQTMAHSAIPWTSTGHSWDTLQQRAHHSQSIQCSKVHLKHEWSVHSQLFIYSSNIFLLIKRRSLILQC